MSLKKNKIGILGGTFDPAHKGHLTISKEAVKRFMLKEVIWAITKKNPFKRRSNTNLTTRIKNCKKIIGNKKYIKVGFYEDTIKSNRTINLINFFYKKKRCEIYFLNRANNYSSISNWRHLGKTTCIFEACRYLPAFRT